MNGDAPRKRCAPPWSNATILSCVSVGSCWKRSATTPDTTGADIDVPVETPCVSSICMQRLSFSPEGLSGHPDVVNTLPGVPGSAAELIADTTNAPGAAISGFATPVAFGPALENQHTSPSPTARTVGVS